MAKTPPRRRFQFGLGTLFWLVALTAVSAFAFHEHQERMRLQVANHGQEVEVKYLRSMCELQRHTQSKWIMQLLSEPTSSPPATVPTTQR
ncbi:MAG: hypothetical protein HYX69_04045 [Planctomycetia bacterium]|nr:hypothetical protein [Planctomycetia bacterium]